MKMIKKGEIRMGAMRILCEELEKALPEEVNELNKLDLKSFYDKIKL